MSNEFDYNKYDSISLALKENEYERMISYYRAFGWEEYEKNEDKRYFDIVHAKLMRPHKIENKDRLQLLQVKMEYAVNRFAQLRKNKHSRSVIFGLTLGILALGLAALGVMLLLNDVLLPLSVALLSLGLASPLFIVPFVKETANKENKSFARSFKEMTSEISEIISKAKKLCGEENDEK
jgi:hypothetical protein